MDHRRSVLMEKYELGRVLGQGTFAKVYYARHLITGQSVAIKVIDKEKILRVGLMDQVKREISVMKLVRHPNIVRMYEVLATKTKVYFILEYVKGGELFDKVAKKKLKEDVARKYFQQLIGAVDFCHSRGVYHRDLKPENVLLDEHENLKVSDFGLSALAESKRQDGLLHTSCGTPAYVAPEVINRKGYAGDKADIWSCGVILYVLLAGYLPFRDSNLMEMYKKIGKAEYKCPTYFPTEVRRLLFRILDPYPDTRISMSKIKQNSWVRKGLDLEPTRIDLKDKDVAFSSEDTVTDTASGSGSSEEPEMGKAESLNAFDIISLSAGFDLSSLFEEPGRKKETRFTSRQPAAVIISALEGLAKTLKLNLRKREKGLLKLESLNEGRKGVVSIDTEIFEVTPSFHLVEMKKSSGDTLEYQKILKEGIRPGLQDIVWAWQGDQQKAEMKIQPKIVPNEPQFQRQQMPL